MDQEQRQRVQTERDVRQLRRPQLCAACLPPAGDVGRRPVDARQISHSEVRHSARAPTPQQCFVIKIVSLLCDQTSTPSVRGTSD